MDALRAPGTASRSIFGRFFAGAAVLALATAAFCEFFAGRLLAHTRSDAPAVLRFVFRAGRFLAISSWLRPERTLYACASTSHPGTAESSRFLMISHSLP